MGRAIDLFVTYRFIKLLVTPYEKQEAYKLGVIDKNGNRVTIPGTNKATPLDTVAEKNSYTVLHKLVFNIKKIFGKVPGLRTKLGTYAAALFLLKDTFKEDVDPQMWEKQFMKYLKENNIELDDTISEETTLEDGKLPKGIYKLQQDITFDKEKARSEIKNSESISEEINSFPNKKVRRNSPCPCGSGKKFKHCCGAI